LKNIENGSGDRSVQSKSGELSCKKNTVETQHRHRASLEQKIGLSSLTRDLSDLLVNLLVVVVVV